MKNITQELTALALLLCTLNGYSQSLSSYPVVGPTIFLDFDGHTVTGTQWNTNGTIVCAPSNMGAAQREQVYNMIAEDYRPFTVNITTDSTFYHSAPANKRMRMIFTTSHTWYPQAVGGVSYINSFTWGDNTPGFVFTAALNYSLKKIAEAGSHEAGHTLGLRHQASYDGSCTKLTDYNAGTGTGEIGWAPIMGVGYTKNFTTWNSGPNSLGCATIQNDLDVITKAVNGITYRTDEYTETFATASAVQFVNNQINVEGVIAKNTDKDMIRFTLAKEGRLFLNVIPYNVGSGNSGSDLDLNVQLFDAAQQPVGTYNPAPLLNSIVDTTLAAGSYYMLIDGKGNQFASEYGSLGSYKLQGIYSEAIILPLHKFELKGINENGIHRFNWDVIADEKITSQTLQVAYPGGNFHAVSEVDADARNYSYYAATPGSMQYRVKVTVDNGSVYYSNTIVLRNTTAVKPQLTGTVIYSNTLIVNATENYNYTVSDYSGKMISGGKLTAGRNDITLPAIAAGSYLIRFTNNNTQFVEKFVKQ